MQRELPCLSGGERVGRAHYEENRLRLQFHCFLPGQSGLCKLWLVRGERKMLLGTPAPEGRGLALSRGLSRSALEQAGVYPPERLELLREGETPLAEAETGDWNPVSDTAPEFADPFLRRVFRQGGWGWRRWKNGVVLCHAWAEQSPFPAPPLFCFAHVEHTSQRIRVCYYLNERGEPVFFV